MILCPSRHCSATFESAGAYIAHRASVHGDHVRSARVKSARSMFDEIWIPAQSGDTPPLWQELPSHPVDPTSGFTDCVEHFSIGEGEHIVVIAFRYRPDDGYYASVSTDMPGAVRAGICALPFTLGTFLPVDGTYTRLHEVPETWDRRMAFSLFRDEQLSLEGLSLGEEQ